MLLVDEFIQMNITQEFKDMFLVVIQLGAILAVVILFWEKMWPSSGKQPPSLPCAGIPFKCG